MSKILAALFVCLLLVLPATNAQTGPAPTVSDQLGIIPYQSYQGGDVDSVNLSSGKINIHIPLVAYPQRGGLLKESFSANATANPSAVSLLPCQPDFCPLYGWRSGVGTPSVVEDQPPSPSSVYVGQVISGQQYYYWYGRLFTSDGGSHLVGQTAGPVRGPNTTPSGTSYRTLDGSGYSFGTDASGNWTTWDSLGIKYSGTTREDPNGNQISVSSNSVTDTLGRNIPLATNTTASDSTSCPQGGTLLPISSATIWTVPGPNGGSFQIKFCYALVNHNFPTYLTILGNSAQVIGFRGSMPALQSIVFLANNTAWSFEYNDQDGTTNNGSPVNFGSLTKITMPTGGTISYTYTWAGNTTDQGSRWVASRAVNANDGSGAHTWNYAYGTGNATTVTDPLGNDAVHTFTSYGTGSLYETQAQYYQGPKSSNVLLKTVATQYLSNVSPGAGGAASVFPSTITTTWTTGQVQQVQKITKSFDSGFSYVGNNVNAYYGKVLSESDYGTSAPGPTLRTTATNYMFLSNSNYLNNNMLNLVSNVKVSDGNANQLSYAYYNYDENTPSSSGITMQHDANPPAGTYRGNQTSVHRSLSSGTFTCPDGSSGGSGGYLLSKTTFYDTGKVGVAKDPCSHSTTYLYSSTYYGAFPTTVTNALSQSTINVYDFNTGLLTSTTDPNQLVTTYSHDSMWRLSQVNHPNGAQDTVARQETTFPFTATATPQINIAKSKSKTNVSDGLGRVSQTQLTSDPQGTVYTDTTYDALDRVATVSNPYRTAPDPTSSPGTATYTYDALGRKTKETYADNSALTTAYCGPNTLVTDPTGKWRRSRVNGLGQLVEVDEPNSTTATVASTGCPGTNEPIWVTSYTNNALGNLTQIVQNGSHTRTFTYDSLSRLLTAANPETGTITYTYNPDGTLLTKKDARNITANYTYDALHRETGITYSNSDPSLTFTYDETGCLSLTACQNIGHRTSMTDGAGSEKWAYQVDQPHLQSIHREQRTNNSTPSNITKTTTYYLDLAGNVTQLVYPTSSTGRTVNYTYDAADRPSTAADAGSNGITYATDWKTPPTGTNCIATAVCYTPQGSVYSMSIGQTSSYNGFNISETFNNRLQPNEIKAGTAIDITYNFVDPVSLKNAGHVYAITNNLTSGRSQAFTYDQLNRIASAGTTATTGSSCWGYQFTYDAWGNLLSQAGWSPTYNACTESTMGAVTADGNNHISGLTYDSSGNTQTDGNNTYTWDGESQLKTAAGVTYNYDGEGRRAAKVGSKLYWYGSGGEILSETDAAGNTLSDYIFFGGKRVALVPASGSALYYAEDQLGSSRVIVQSNGTLCYDADFVPFGGEKTQTSTCAQNYKFGGKERDTETQNDDFGARYYSWRIGRWLSSDWSAIPVAVPYANLTNPQTLNLYSMVSDDPESFADLDGHGSAVLQQLESEASSSLCKQGVVAACDSGAEQQSSAAAQQSQPNQTQQAQEQNPNTQQLQNLMNGLDTITKPVQPLAEELQKLPDVDVNASATVLGVTKSTDGSTSLTPAVIGASVDVKATLVKNPTQEIGDVEVGVSKHTAVNGSVVLNSDGKPRLGSVGASVGAAWPETGRLSGSVSLDFVQKAFDHAAAVANKYIMERAYGSGP